MCVSDLNQGPAKKKVNRVLVTEHCKSLGKSKSTNKQKSTNAVKLSDLSGAREDSV